MKYLHPPGIAAQLQVRPEPASRHALESGFVGTVG
jgi:hypothetical protein